MVQLTPQLTKQQLRIAELVAEAKSNQEICNDLHIELNTLKRHLKMIYSKLGYDCSSGCANRVKLALAMKG